jgi:hypothetical protein
LSVRELFFQLAGRGWQGDGGGDFGVVNCLLLLAIAIGDDDQAEPDGVGAARQRNLARMSTRLTVRFSSSVISLL